jgi:hypothetical protein
MIHRRAARIPIMISGFLTGPILPVMGIKRPNAITVWYKTKITGGSVLDMYTTNLVCTGTENHTQK